MKTKICLFTLFSILTTLMIATFNPIKSVEAATLPVVQEPGALPALTEFKQVSEATPEPVADIEHTLIPVTGSGKEQVIHDQVNTSTASQKRANGGEEYNFGRMERPFDKDMKFLGFLDIVKSTLQREDKNFIYITIQVAAPVSTAEDKPAFYGFEIDTNMDGRSEYLILAEKPLNTEWSVSNVNVWKSSSAEAPIPPTGPAIPVTGSLGYDVSVFAEGTGEDPDLVWARLSPEKEDTVEIAFKNTLIGGEKGKFVWRPMTDGAPYPNTVYDLHLSYSLVEAGSPLGDSMFYPLKEVYAVDNTCRVASGYEASGREPGLCPLPPPPSKPSQPSNPNHRNPNQDPTHG